MGKKKYLALIPLLLIGGIASGALVKYLSNTLTLENVKIESPLMLSGLQGPTEVYGGDTWTYTYAVENRANSKIKGVFKFIIHEPDKASEEDLASYSFAVCEATNGRKCVGKHVEAEASGTDYILTSEPVELGAKHSYEVDWTLTFNPAIKPGTYSVETCVVPA